MSKLYYGAPSTEFTNDLVVKADEALLQYMATEPKDFTSGTIARVILDEIEQDLVQHGIEFQKKQAQK